MSTFKKAKIGIAFLSPTDKVIKTQLIKEAMQSSDYFPEENMPISYVVIQQLIDNLSHAISLSKNDDISNSYLVHAHEQLLVSAFSFIKTYVENIANKTVVPMAVIRSAGMQVISVAKSNRVSQLTLKALGNGELQIQVPRSVNEKAFVVEKSLDGTMWIPATVNTSSTIRLNKLPVSTTLHIRYCAISKTGKNNYCNGEQIVIK